MGSRRRRVGIKTGITQVLIYFKFIMMSNLILYLKKTGMLIALRMV